MLGISIVNGFNNKLPKLPSKTIRSLVLDKVWSYPELLDNLKNINEVTLVDKGSKITDVFAIQEDTIHKVEFIPDLSQSLMKKLLELGVPFHIKSIPMGIQLSPIDFIVGYFVLSFLFSFFMKNPRQNNFMNPMQMFKKESEIDTSIIDISFNDVAGCDEAKFELTEMVDFLKNPKKYEDAGAKIPKGLLLEGPPGTGKTLLAKAVAGEANVPFFYASGSEFIEMYVGVGASRVRDLFEKAEKEKPCVIFIDEIDAIGRQRGAGLAGGNDEREQTLNQILTNMDGFKDSTGVLVIAATNRADILDQALTRPGRFDRKVNVGLPDSIGREKILEVHLKNKNVKNIDMPTLSSLTSGFSGADLANMANEAAILSVRNNNTSIDQQNLLDAFEKMSIGLPCSTETRSQEILEMVSYHEIGHALIAALFTKYFSLQKITIQSNKNGAGGYTLFIPNEPYDSYPTKKFILARIMVAFGGRIAEEILYKDRKKNLEDNLYDDVYDISTGASNDLKQANQLAKNYINLFGKTLVYSDSDPSTPFLGRTIANSQHSMSDYLKEEKDKEMVEILDYCYEQTEIMLESYKDQLHKYSKLLLEYKTIGNIEL